MGDWGFFIAIIATLLILDLGVLHKNYRVISIKESLLMSLFYVTIGLLFALWIYQEHGLSNSLTYVTAYLIEKSLSMDNIFVMAVIFKALCIPKNLHHRVLFWGVLGVLVLRAVMIMAGIEIIEKMHGILYLFGAFLIITGLKMLRAIDQEKKNVSERYISWIKKYIPLTPKLHKEHFFIQQKNKWYATPLFLALVMIECADIIFAVDSVPAVLLLTQDPYIVYTSNIFAILGLRSLYFILDHLSNRFYYLNKALALILIFIGSKVFLFYLGIEIPSTLSLGVTLVFLTGGILFSLYKTSYVDPKRTSR